MALKDWTIMVYLGADNNLGQEMIWALKDIYQTQSELGNNIKVVALYDGGGPPRRFDPLRDSTERKKQLEKRHNGHQAIAAKSSVCADRSEDGLLLELADQKRTREKPSEQKGKKSTTSVDSIEQTLTTFILDTTRQDPAEHYMLVLSGHGSGVVGEFLPAQKRLFGLTIPTLREVLKSVRKELKNQEGSKKIDILGLDACEMSMTEIAYEVREEVDFVIGAEGFQPNTGWPFDRVLEIFKTKVNPADICKDIVKENIKFYLDYTTADVSVDTSAIALGLGFEKIQRLISTLNGFTTALGLKEKHEREGELETRKNASAFADKDLVDAIVLARRDAQGYKNEQFVDVWDFCDCLISRLTHLKGLLGPAPKDDEESKKADELRKRLTRIENLTTACNTIKDAIAGNVGLVISSAYTGASFQHSHGVSIYFPWANLTDAAGIADVDHYQLLEFARDTMWDEFIRLFHSATIRDRREADFQFPVRLSMLNRRTGLFTGGPGHRDPEVSSVDRDPEVSSVDRTTGGTVRIASMKNPPIEWCEYRFD